MDDLPALPAIALGRYRHYKGGEYAVLGVVRHSETLEPMVLYRPLHGTSGPWVRPFGMFLETVVHEGRMQPRFSLLAPQTSLDEAELRATVARMDAKLSASEQPQVRQLMRLYRELALRFERDLAACEKDVLLAQASALMLVQAAAA